MTAQPLGLAGHAVSHVGWHWLAPCRGDGSRGERRPPADARAGPDRLDLLSPSRHAHAGHGHEIGRLGPRLLPVHHAALGRDRPRGRRGGGGVGTADQRPAARGAPAGRPAGSAGGLPAGGLPAGPPGTAGRSVSGWSSRASSCCARWRTPAPGRPSPRILTTWPKAAAACTSSALSVTAGGGPSRPRRARSCGPCSRSASTGSHPTGAGSPRAARVRRAAQCERSHTDCLDVQVRGPEPVTPPGAGPGGAGPAGPPGAAIPGGSPGTPPRTAPRPARSSAGCAGDRRPPPRR